MKTKQLPLLFFTLAFIQLSTGCHKEAQISKLVSDNGQSYFEIKDAHGLHKVYSREVSGSGIVLIMDEKNIPEVMALISSEGKAVVAEYRGEQGVSPAGLQLIDASYMSGVNSDDPAFAQWKQTFAVFRISKERRSKTLKLEKEGLKPQSVIVGDNSIALSRPIDCRINVASSSGFRCSQSEACICAFKALCAAAVCVQGGNVGCFRENLNKVSACLGLGTFEQGEGRDQGSLNDLQVVKINGIYNLAY